MSNYQLKHSEENYKLAWQVILGLLGVMTLCFLAGIGQVLVPIFPFGSLAVGIFLYWRYPYLYVGFTWWLWFLSPLIHRSVQLG